MLFAGRIIYSTFEASVIDITNELKEDVFKSLPERYGPGDIINSMQISQITSKVDGLQQWRGEPIEKPILGGSATIYIAPRINEVLKFFWANNALETEVPNYKALGPFLDKLKQVSGMPKLVSTTQMFKYVKNGDHFFGLMEKAKGIPIFTNKLTYSLNNLSMKKQKLAFSAIGRALATFHAQTLQGEDLDSYSAVLHGDFHLSNVFVDPLSRPMLVTFIDIGSAGYIQNNGLIAFDLAKFYNMLRSGLFTKNMTAKLEKLFKNNFMPTYARTLFHGNVKKQNKFLAHFWHVFKDEKASNFFVEKFYESDIGKRSKWYQKTRRKEIEKMESEARKHIARAFL